MFVNTSSAFANALITGRATLSGYNCGPDLDPEVAVNAVKREAVVNAEAQCDWNDGRPEVRRTGQWTVDVRCRAYGGDLYSGFATAEATFECMAP